MYVSVGRGLHRKPLSTRQTWVIAEPCSAGEEWRLISRPTTGRLAPMRCSGLKQQEVPNLCGVIILCVVLVLCLLYFVVCCVFFPFNDDFPVNTGLALSRQRQVLKATESLPPRVFDNPIHGCARLSQPCR